METQLEEKKNMEQNATNVLRGRTRVEGTVEGEALVTTEKLSHLYNAIGNDGVIRMNGHPLMGKSYAGKIIVYDTDIFSTGGAWGLYFKCKITEKGPKGLICRNVHPISVGGAVDAGIPAVDGFDVDPCRAIKTGDRIRITASGPGGEASVEILERGGNEPVAISEPKTASAEGWPEDRLKLTSHEEEMLEGKHGKAKQVAMARLVKFGQGMGSTKMARICSAHVFSDWERQDLVIGAWPIFKEFAEMDAKVVMPTTVESTFMADELVDDPGMPWHYKTRTSARDVYDAMKPVHDNLQSMGAYVIPTCIPYMPIISCPAGTPLRASSDMSYTTVS